jgi:hypothetical protein
MDSRLSSIRRLQRPSKHLSSQTPNTSQRPDRRKEESERQFEPATSCAQISDFPDSTPNFSRCLGFAYSKESPSRPQIGSPPSDASPPFPPPIHKYNPLRRRRHVLSEAAILRGRERRDPRVGTAEFRHRAARPTEDSLSRPIAVWLHLFATDYIAGHKDIESHNIKPLFPVPTRMLIEENLVSAFRKE